MRRPAVTDTVGALPAAGGQRQSAVARRGAWTPRRHGHLPARVRCPPGERWRQCRSRQARQPRAHHYAGPLHLRLAIQPAADFRRPLAEGPRHSLQQVGQRAESRRTTRRKPRRSPGSACCVRRPHHRAALRRELHDGRRRSAGQLIPPHGSLEFGGGTRLAVRCFQAQRRGDIPSLCRCRRLLADTQTGVHLAKSTGGPAPGSAHWPPGFDR